MKAQNEIDHWAPVELEIPKSSTIHWTIACVATKSKIPKFRAKRYEFGDYFMRLVLEHMPKLIGTLKCA